MLESLAYIEISIKTMRKHVLQTIGRIWSKKISKSFFGKKFNFGAKVDPKVMFCPHGVLAVSCMFRGV